MVPFIYSTVVPGVYSLEPTSKAEEVAVKMLEEGDIVINIVDSTHLERNLYLTLQLLERKIPVIVALNLWDEAKHKGIEIDKEKLEELLGVPVVPTVAITGEGIRELVSRLPEAKPRNLKLSEEERWKRIGEIVSQVQKVYHRHHTLSEILGEASVKPLTGIPIAFGVMFLTFTLIRFIGENLINYVFDPLFELYTPVAMSISNLLGSGFIHDILIGQLIEGEIDYFQSMGLITTGIYVPFAAVLPYVFAFYLVLGFLEDSGYLPRLAVLVDNVMHRMGLHGSAIISMLLGLGCNVPGALSTRVLETKRQRFIAATLMAIAVPCMAQTAIIIGLVGVHGEFGLLIVFGSLLIVWIVLGLVLNKVIGGESPEIFMEIPSYRFPYWGALLKKLWIRVRGFLMDAVPFVLLGVLLVNVLYALGIIEFIGRVSAPIITGLLGLPKEAVVALIIGFLRKDVAVGMLLPLGLTLKQAVIASVVLAMYFPCVATFAVLVKELGIVDMLKSTTIMVALAFFVGAVLNIIL
jgi:ferrous iron transport protein B